MQMRDSGKRILLFYTVCGVITLIASFWITDNDSPVFQALVWAVSLVILLAGSVVGYFAGHLLSGVWFGIRKLFGSLFSERVLDTDFKKNRFFRVFRWVYLFICLIVLFKFGSDFLFAEFTPAYLLFSGSLGLLNGALLLLCKGSRKQDKNIWIE